MTNEELEKLWIAQTPSCLTCGWSPAFYEVSELILNTSKGIWHSPCVNPDTDAATGHDGQWLYEKSEQE